jgi:hypothetical protein
MAGFTHILWWSSRGFWSSRAHWWRTAYLIELEPLATRFYATRLSLHTKLVGRATTTTTTVWRIGSCWKRAIYIARYKSEMIG